MEEWLKKLVDDIKEKDRGVAEHALHEAQIAKVIAEQSPQYWDALSDSLKTFVEEAKELFGDDPTAGALAFNAVPPRGNQRQIGIVKGAYPFIQFNATFPGQITYAKGNPHQGSPGSVSSRQITSQFQVHQHDGQDKVFLQLDGKDFHEPREAAKYIMELLLAV